MKGLCGVTWKPQSDTWAMWQGAPGVVGSDKGERKQWLLVKVLAVDGCILQLVCT